MLYYAASGYGPAGEQNRLLKRTAPVTGYSRRFSKSLMISTLEQIFKGNRAVFIFEFKYRKSAKAALKQCHARKYALPYANDSRRIVYVGVNYDTLNDTLNSRVLAIVRQRPGVRRPDMMTALGVSESTIARCLRTMKAQVEFRGAAKTGGYYVLDKVNR